MEAAEVNKRLFNTDTVDHVIAHLMQNGVKVEGGDRLGKTIVFAKNQDHADFIEQRFDAAYPSLAGHFARVITHQTGAYAQTLIDDFSEKTKAAHRDLGRHARHRHRRAGGRQPRVLQAGALQDQVLADDGARHAALPGLFGPGRTRSSSASSTLRESRILRRRPEVKEAGAASPVGAAVHGAVDLVRRWTQARPGFGERRSAFDAAGATAAERGESDRRLTFGTVAG